MDRQLIQYQIAARFHLKDLKHVSSSDPIGHLHDSQSTMIPFTWVLTCIASLKYSIHSVRRAELMGLTWNNRSPITKRRLSGDWWKSQIKKEFTRSSDIGTYSCYNTTYLPEAMRDTGQGLQTTISKGVNKELLVGNMSKHHSLFPNGMGYR